MNTWIGGMRMLVIAGLAVVGIGVGMASGEVLVKEFHEGTLFARGDHVTVTAQTRADLVAMGWMLKIRSQVGGDVTAMGGKVYLEGTANGDVVAVGGSIETTGTLNNGVVFVGGRIGLGGSIKGPLLVFGGRVVSKGEILNSAKFIGGTVTGESTVGGNLQVAAGRVDLGKETVVRGTTWIAAGKARLQGRYEGELRVAAREVTIDGEVLGDLMIDAVEVVIAPSAVVRGNLLYRGPAEAKIHPDARIDGDVEFTRSEKPRRFVGFWLAVAGLAVLGVIGGLILQGAVVTALIPRMFPVVADRVVMAPWRSLAVGSAVVFGLPLLMMVLKLTIIGAPLALCLMAAYVIVLPMGLLAAAYWVGRRGLRLAKVTELATFPRRLAVVALGVSVLSVICLIPVLGVLATLVALLLGTGALVLEAHDLCHLVPSGFRGFSREREVP
jgi:hypothetical protein